MPNAQWRGRGNRGPRHPAVRSLAAIRMFMSPCPTRTTPPDASACDVSTIAALEARSRAVLKLSTPADQPQNHAERASAAHSIGRRRRPDRMAHGNSASRKQASISGAADGARSRAESCDRRSGLVTRHFATRMCCSSSALGLEDGSSGAVASPRSQSPSAYPAIGVRKSHAGLPCRARTIVIRLRPEP